MKGINNYAKNVLNAINICGILVLVFVLNVLQFHVSFYQTYTATYMIKSETVMFYINWKYIIGNYQSEKDNDIACKQKSDPVHTSHRHRV